MFGIKKLEKQIKLQEEIITSLRNNIYEAQRAHKRLLTYLKLHEVTEPSTPERKKFLTDEEYTEYCKNRPETPNSFWGHYYSSPDPFSLMWGY
jgi:hypothetical protein